MSPILTTRDNQNTLVIRHAINNTSNIQNGGTSMGSYGCGRESSSRVAKKSGCERRVAQLACCCGYQPAQATVGGGDILCDDDTFLGPKIGSESLSSEISSIVRSILVWILGLGILADRRFIRNVIQLEYTVMQVTSYDNK